MFWREKTERMLTFQTNKTSFVLAVQQEHFDDKNLHIFGT